MGVPMDWSVVEPAVGILVSSLPAIRSILYLFQPKYGRSQNSSSFRSNIEGSKGHIQLRDFHNADTTTTVGTNRKVMPEDDDSEKNLIYQGTNLPSNMIGISTTTEVSVTHTGGA
jgi:hypothetical protein